MNSATVKYIKIFLIVFTMLIPAYVNAQLNGDQNSGSASNSNQFSIGAQKFNFTSPITGLEKKQSGPAEVFPRVITDKPVDPDNYVIGVGDRMVLIAMGKVNSNIFLTVGPEGKVVLPDAGGLTVAKMTISQAEEEIRKKLKRRYPNVNFELLLAEPRAFKVYVLGEVVHPGAHILTSLERVSDAVVRAGGIKRSGTQRKIEVRREGKIVPADLYLFTLKGDFNQNPLLLENDIIYVSLSLPKVTVGGGVQRPGIYELEKDETLSQLLNRIDGVSRNVSRSKPIKIIRLNNSGNKQTLKVSLESVLTGDKTIELKDGDNIFVPSVDEVPPNETNIYVSGEVKKPGAYPYVPGYTAKNYVGLAGGITQRSRYSQAKIIKSNGEKIVLTDDTVLEVGDTVYIPEKFIKVWQDCLVITTSISSLTLAVIAAFK